MLQPDAVPAGTMDLLKELSAHPVLKNFRLVGGTSLALQIGHRLSIDLDFFSDDKNDMQQIADELMQLDGMKLNANSNYALFLNYKNVKIDILNYPYKFISPAIQFEEIQLAHTDDIAAMKLKTIMNRGAKKDFYDLYFLLQKYSIQEFLELFVRKYTNIEPVAIFKSLTYFDDAEPQENPVLLKNKSLTWEQVKKRIVEETRKLL